MTPETQEAIDAAKIAAALLHCRIKIRGVSPEDWLQQYGNRFRERLRSLADEALRHHRADSIQQQLFATSVLDSKRAIDAAEDFVRRFIADHTD
jgi:hypothetical protein